MICSYCGKDNAPGEKFCYECGNVLLNNPVEEQHIEMNQPAEIKCPFCNKMHPVDIEHCPETGDILPRPLPKKSVKEKRDIKTARLILPDNSEIVIDNQEQVLGRTAFEKSIAADDLLHISRNHFIITWDDKKHYIEDKNSKNGTIVNGVKIKGKGKFELKEGYAIEVGKTVSIIFRIDK